MSAPGAAAAVVGEAEQSGGQEQAGARERPADVWAFTGVRFGAAAP
jgi:hypothetical protein